MTTGNKQFEQGSGRSPVERALGLVTELRSGEATTALLLTLNVFVLLTAYYVIKPVREGLILELQSGAEYKSYLGGGIAIALLVVVPLYVQFARNVSRGKLVTNVTLFFASHLVLFYAGSHVSTVRENLGLVFYLWVGIFNMMLVAQFWAFANDIYTEEQGKRLFPLVGIGASLGAAVGSQIARGLAIPLGRYPLLLVSAALLCVCALLFRLVHLREVSRTANEASATTRLAGTSMERTGKGAFGLVIQHRYLRLLAAFSVVFTMVNTNGEYLLSRLIQQSARDEVQRGTLAAASAGDFITAQFGEFFLYVNVIGVALQMFAVSRIIKYAGLRIAFFLLPCIALLGSVAFAAIPVLAVLRWSKVAENATDYSLNNTVRNTLWLPTSEEMKYRAKQAVDTFFVRMGDVGSTLCVLLFAAWLGVELRQFVLINLVLILAWLVLAVAIIRENRRMSEAN